jgi:hypothetical protein
MRLKNLRKYLAEWLYPIDTVELIRRRYALLTDQKSFEEMEKDEQDRLCANAFTLVSNPAFNVVLEYLADDQINYTACLSPSWDSVILGRGSVNGISKVEEEFNKLALIHKTSLQNEKYNEHDII